MGYAGTEEVSRLQKACDAGLEAEEGGLSGHINTAVKQRKVIRASKFTVVFFDAVIGDYLGK